jgi:hypothetical protein
VTEDGKQQALKVFEYQKLEDDVLPPPTEPDLAVPVEPVSTVKPAVALTFAPPPPGEVKYKNKRLMLMFFDMAGMPIADQLRSQQAAEKFLKTQMTASDMVGVMTYTTDCDGFGR